MDHISFIICYKFDESRNWWEYLRLGGRGRANNCKAEHYNHKTKIVYCLISGSDKIARAAVNITKLLV